MRVAPIAMMYSGENLDAEIPAAFAMGGNVAKLTHGHPVSTLASGVMVVLVLQLLAGRALPEALTVAKGLLDTNDMDGREVWGALTHAEELADSSLEPTDAITKLGGGWIAEEALSISVYACLKAQSLKETLLIAVNHSGDSDSTGAIAGNLAGAVYGVQAIHAHWLAQLELRDVIQAVADDLHDCGGWELSLNKETLESQRIWQRYPGW